VNFDQSLGAGRESAADSLADDARVARIVHRVCAEVQRAHFDAPDLSRCGSSKYR
jgi:hypothetical protein